MYSFVLLYTPALTDPSCVVSGTYLGPILLYVIETLLQDEQQ